MTYENGDFYDGEWKDGDKHGEGFFRFLQDEQEFRGRFEKGHFAEGTYKWEYSDEGEKF